jgi:hypothetical protein
MWWIIGAVAAFLMLMLLKRGSAKPKHQALVAAGQSHLRSSLLIFSHRFPAEYDSRVWEDRYLLGYMQGSIAMMVAFFGPPMSTKDKGMVFIDTLRGLKPEGWQDVCERVFALASANDPEYLRGMEHAGNVVGLSANRLRPEIMADLDIQAALADAPAFERSARAVVGGETHPDFPHASAAGCLMSTYMIRHKAALDALQR